MQTEQPFHRCARKEPESVADALKVALLGDVNTNPDSPSNENVDAYNAYMQGRYYEARYAAEDFRKAIGFYENAIASDPYYALAYAALSRSLWALGDITGEDVDEANRKARAAAERAIAENPNLAEGHSALSQILISVDRNAKGAEVEARRAVELAPKSAEPKITLASMIANFGRIEEAVELLQQAVRLEPLVTAAHFDLARLLTSLGRYDEAVQAAHSAQCDRPPARRRRDLGNAGSGRGETRGAPTQWRWASRPGATQRRRMRPSKL
jgi:serine/threonine-protein kinase